MCDIPVIRRDSPDAAGADCRKVNATLSGHSGDARTSAKHKVHGACRGRRRHLEDASTLPLITGRARKPLQGRRYDKNSYSLLSYINRFEPKRPNSSSWATRCLLQEQQRTSALFSHVLTGSAAPAAPVEANPGKLNPPIKSSRSASSEAAPPPPPPPSADFVTPFSPRPAAGEAGGDGAGEARADSVSGLLGKTDVQVAMERRGRRR